MTIRKPAREERRRLGAYYTPGHLVEFVLDRVLDGMGGPVASVLDPSCGDGRFLAAAALRVPDARLVGIDVDPAAVESARAAIGPVADVVCADTLSLDWTHREPFDLVVGNPPFLSQLSARSSRGGRSPLGGGAYADAAALFLALSATLVRPGGRVGLVLPQSLLATRDAREIRDQLEATGAIRDLWIAGGNVFDASVLTVVLTFERSASQGAVARWRGPTFTAAAPVAFEVGRSTWSHLLTDAPTAIATTSGVLGNVAAITADFRDQYYGLKGHVHDGGSGPALVTSGLIDLGSHAWGQRPTTFMRTTYQAPRVDVSALEPKLQAWAAARLVAKVLVATQTRVLEACVDADGTLLPSVPVITAVPTTHLGPWSLAAVICSPFASAWAARESTGAALSTTAIKLSARQLAALPLPAEPWTDAVEALQAGDHETFGRRMDRAYRLADTDVFDWWMARVSGTRRRVRSRPER